MRSSRICGSASRAMRHLPPWKTLWATCASASRKRSSRPRPNWRPAHATIAKLTSDREKLETYTKKTLGNVQEKYSVLVQTYKNQIRDKQERISRLEGELERHRRELASSREFTRRSRRTVV